MDEIFPCCFPVSHVTSQRGVQPESKVDSIYPCVLHTVLITIPEPNWDIFLLMRVFTVCVVVYYYGHGARAYINECYHGYLAIL